MPADILLYAIVAAGLVFWLKSVLGTRHGEERERPNPFAAQSKDKAEPTQIAAPAAALPINHTPEEEPKIFPPYFSVAESAQPGLADIARQDRAFDLSHFASGVADAFAFVVESFADGDRATLKDLLAPPVYTAFERALNERESAGEKVATEIHAVRKAELTGAAVRDGMAYLTVRFTADETCVIRDKNDLVLSGHPDLVTEMVDVWTFGRPVMAKDPRWLVYETSDGDVTEAHKTPVPDAQ